MECMNKNMPKRVTYKTDRPITFPKAADAGDLIAITMFILSSGFPMATISEELRSITP